MVLFVAEVEGGHDEVDVWNVDVEEGNDEVGFSEVEEGNDEVDGRDEEEDCDVDVVVNGGLFSFNFRTISPRQHSKIEIKQARPFRPPLLFRLMSPLKL